MRIAIVGAGYVGLVSGACLADLGHDVTCIDKDKSKIAALRRGETPIFEPGLAEMIARNVHGRRLTFDSSLAGTVKAATAIFIAVGTPSRRGDGIADLTYVYEAARAIVDHITGFKVIITKSTVPVGTADELTRIIRDRRPESDVEVVSNPEFLREGAAIADFMKPSRIIIGSDHERAVAVMKEIYAPLLSNEVPLIVTSPRSAELTKYACNAFLATKITFMNEVADLCERVGADVHAIARGMGYDDRIGSKFLAAGPGYGGSCFPKDTLALTQTAHAHQLSLRIVEAVAFVNQQRKRAMGRKVIAACGGSVRDRLIAVLGLTFKPNTDDMRDAPSLVIIETLQDAGARIRAYDPVGIPQAKALLNDVTFAENPYDCADDADALVIVTEWKCFRELDLRRIRDRMLGPVLVDLRNIYLKEEAERYGFSYVSVGRGETGVRLPNILGDDQHIARKEQGRLIGRDQLHVSANLPLDVVDD